jgi:hypothetical protein
MFNLKKGYFFLDLACSLIEHPISKLSLAVFEVNTTDADAKMCKVN